MTDPIIVEQPGAVLELRFNRPQRRNALTHAMYHGLREGLERARNEDGIRCTVITGQPDCFTAGNDLGDFAQGLDGHFMETAVGRFLTELVEHPKPIVAAPNGPAVGIGTTLLLHCDLVYAGSNARFQLPFVNLGLCPEAASSLLLPQWLGRVRASELLLLGEPFGAEQARDWGLVNGVREPNETREAALAAAGRLAERPPAAMRACKAMIREGNRAAIRETMTREGALFAERLQSPEAQEAFRAFAEKRSPDFSSFN